MQNLHHPNWSGKNHRTRDEAFGGRYHSARPRGEHWGWWVVGVCLLSLLFFLALAAPDTQAQTINYVERSLNKTIVVDRGQAQTLTNSNGGVRVITKRERNDCREKDKRRFAQRPKTKRR